MCLIQLWGNMSEKNKVIVFDIVCGKEWIYTTSKVDADKFILDLVFRPVVNFVYSKYETDEETFTKRLTKRMYSTDLSQIGLA